MSLEIRNLIRKMSLANPLWGAPRIHGELLKLGIDVSQATVGRYLPWRPKVPSPTWRSFLHNHMHDTAAVDMFVVVTARFQLLYALLVLGHERREVIHFDVTQNPTQVWLAPQGLPAVLDVESRHGQPGRPAVPKHVRELIRKMSRENPLWGAPRIHGELLKLGVDIGVG